MNFLGANWKKSDSDSGTDKRRAPCWDRVSLVKRGRYGKTGMFGELRRVVLSAGSEWRLLVRLDDSSLRFSGTFLAFCAQFRNALQSSRKRTACESEESASDREIFTTRDRSTGIFSFATLDTVSNRKTWQVPWKMGENR